MEKETFTGRGWEPCCGDGAISKVLVETGHDVYSSDLIDRGYGDATCDFLTPRSIARPEVNYVITNPPYKIAEKMLHRALEVADTKVAFLCRLLWIEGEGRFQRVYSQQPPRRIWAFSKRVNMARNNDPRWNHGDGGMVAFAWYVWEKGYTGPTELGWI